MFRRHGNGRTIMKYDEKLGKNIFEYLFLTGMEVIGYFIAFLILCLVIKYSKMVKIKKIHIKKIIEKS